MSRSYRRIPIIQDKYGFKTNKWSKRLANKAVRLYKGDIARGKAYKKIYCSWLISDYSTYCEWSVSTSTIYTRQEWEKIFYRK